MSSCVIVPLSQALQRHLGETIHRFHQADPLVPTQGLLNRAFGPAQVTGIPDWARTEHFDIRTTSALSRTATSEERKEMVRALLVARFGLVTHVESREQATCDLVFARSDHRLGAGLTPSDTDCNRVKAERLASPSNDHPDLPAPPSCIFIAMPAQMRDRLGDKQGRLADRFEGEGTLDDIANALRPHAGRLVSNKTGLPGTYRVSVNFDLEATRRPPAVSTPPPEFPPLLDAIQEQLGLKLESAKTSLDVVVIDHIERPAED